MNIGIFDSGRGGRFVAAKLAQLLPEHHYDVIDDAPHAPYGERPYSEIEKLTHRAIRRLLTNDVIVLACNTATVAALDSLRTKYPDKLMVGFEPMIKPASQLTTSRRITLLATSATANSSRTKQLIETYAANITVDRPDTTGWASAIDDDRPNDIDLSDVEASVMAGSDTIIIGCTHYIALIPRLRELFPKADILEPTEAIASRITELATQLPR